MKEFINHFMGNKTPKGHNCKNSQFVSRKHRAGWLPVYSVLDGGTAGVVVKQFCVDCGKEFELTMFDAKKQPNRISCA